MGIGLYVAALRTFPNSYHYQNLTLHYQAINAEDTSELLIAQRRLHASAIYDSTKSYSVYLCPSSDIFDALAPMSREANATTYQTLNIIHNVILLRSILKFDAIEKADAPRRNRTISGLIATMAIKISLNDNALASNAASWKKIGYAEYVGGDSVMNAHALCQSSGITKIESPLFESLKDQITVTYLLQEEGIRLDSLFMARIDRDSILRIICSKGSIAINH